jgi:hypothetical protein
MTSDEVKDIIRRAFAGATYPGDGALVRSQGEEPNAVIDLFRGKTDWRALTADFVDLAGAASPSALSFFSPAAFRFYLPAYLIADLDGALRYTEPVFFLYWGLDNTTRDLRATTQTWWEVQQAHFAPFTNEEAAAIVEYLRCKAESRTTSEHDQRAIADALRNYWVRRARG